MNRTNVRTQSKVHPWIAGFGALCFALGALDAVADPAGDVPSRKVNFADLNLDSPAGARVLYQRIQSAARAVCGMSEYRTTFEQRNASRKCYQEAITGAVSQINSETLTALHQAKWKGISAG